MLDNLIERLPSPLYDWVLRFDYWLFGSWKPCLHCIDCSYELEGDNEYWWCDLQNSETDWQNTCRAFKKGKRIDEC